MSKTDQSTDTAPDERGRGKTILLCTGIQYANIGDVGHVTGILTLLERFLPEAKIILWTAIDVTEYNDLIRRYWPRVRVVHSRLDGDGDDTFEPTNKEVFAAVEEADFVIGGHGGSMGQIMRWIAQRYDIPYGIVGVTVSAPPTGASKDFVDGASFFYTRDTQSLENLRRSGARCKTMEFAPDATFGSAIIDDATAETFLHEQGLTAGNFICVVPRLRVTPYYRIEPRFRSDPAPWSDERRREVDTLNDAHKEEDHAKARAAMITWVRETGKDVLLCPEMIHNMDLFDELLYEPLPADVKPKVKKRERFWVTDEAAAVYKKAFAVISFECHSPIISSVQGTPAFYLRQPEDTIKGQMWYDFGLSDWVFEIEQSTGDQISDRLMSIVADPGGAKTYLNAAMDKVARLQARMMKNIGDEVNSV